VPDQSLIEALQVVAAAADDPDTDTFAGGGDAYTELGLGDPLGNPPRTGSRRRAPYRAAATSGFALACIARRSARSRSLSPDALIAAPTRASFNSPDVRTVTFTLGGIAHPLLFVRSISRQAASSWSTVSRSKSHGMMWNVAAMASP